MADISCVFMHYIFAYMDEVRAGAEALPTWM